MSRRLYKSIGVSYKQEIDYKKIKDVTKELEEKGRRLGKHGEKFLADKKTLEEEIDKVNASVISERDKADIISQLNAAILVLQEEYEEVIVQEEECVHEKMEEQTEQMQEAIDEWKMQEDLLRGTEMDATSCDTLEAAEAAEDMKIKFEQMKLDYVEKLKLQMEQAEIQHRNVRIRKLSGH